MAGPVLTGDTLSDIRGEAPAVLRTMAAMAITVDLTERPEVALEAARDFLASRPVLHNLIFTLLEGRVRHPQDGRYWVASCDGVPVGVTFHSPFTFHAAVTPMPDDAVDATVTAIADAGFPLPGVAGEAATAARFAGQWTERQKTGASPHQGLRIYELAELVPPASVRGRLRPAEPEDLDLVVHWLRDFYTAIGEVGPAEDVARRRTAAGQVWLWDDGGPRSFAGHSDPAAGVVRVGPVYTPPEHRNRGYAAACVAALSARIAGAGHRCMLFTELSNPVSNSIYRRMGYRAVAECLRYRFDP
jgi:GNAT superfamily N-acetyltransferase